MFLDVTGIDFFMYLGSLGERVPGIFWEKMYLGSLGKNVPWIFWEKYTWDLWEKCTWDLWEKVYLGSLETSSQAPSYASPKL